MVISHLGRRELGRFSKPIALVSGSGHQAQSSRRWAHSQPNLSSAHFSARLNGYREIRNLLLDVTVSKETSMGQRQPEPANQNEKLNARTQAPDGSSTGAEGSDCASFTLRAKKNHSRLVPSRIEKVGFRTGHFHTRHNCKDRQVQSPEELGDVYFRPWANRLFMFHRVNVGENRQKERKNGYNYQDIVDAKRHRTS